MLCSSFSYSRRDLTNYVSHLCWWLTKEITNAEKVN